MVHALEETQRVLKNGGSFIDLRPATQNRTVALELSSTQLHIGEIDSSTTFSDHIAADTALKRLMEQGLIALEHDAVFEVTTDLDSVEDLRIHAGTLRRSILADELLQRIESLIEGEDEDYMIRTRREMVIRRYRSVKP